MNEDRYLNNTQTDVLKLSKKHHSIRPSSRVSRQFENFGKYGLAVDIGMS